MISVIIPTLNHQAHLAETLSALIPAAVEGLVREVIIVDGGSTDRTLEIADGSGADIVTSEAGRGAQLKAGAERARQPWLLFLNADTLLDAGWEREANLHIERVTSGRRRASAAYFQFGFDDDGAMPRVVERLVALRTRVLKLPHGYQGLLISRSLFNEAGGFRRSPVLEDVDLAWRIGRRRLSGLNARVLTIGERFRAEGAFARMAKNQLRLGLYLLGVPLERIAAFTGRREEQPDRGAVAERG
ncbi:TIGR04283 family arsenosugar biosynthesis glycosyltransferase [Hyphomicrobium sp.]|uniref:TIGR04283 family arsenosugar biosynthesis glycosyltransferase n=1 Tax=Hyphomicrobium sp. TaxID=82 RepID=UPI003F727F88